MSSSLIPPVIIRNHSSVFLDIQLIVITSDCSSVPSSSAYFVILKKFPTKGKLVFGFLPHGTRYLGTLRHPLLLLDGIPVMNELRDSAIKIFEMKLSLNLYVSS
ncbi:hypothetical protein LOAG_03992 [Loa loa]|uniref:Uncharacterized protein n=1 Tax=Loa loa TaxID=7209 RepID=A0A1S0U2V0_LOALO|nr:hypothetical protein LOAG_03992 [Loa loa]EFO24491.1 hypothetical protein LOAG_03992 [Loa loa]